MITQDIGIAHPWALVALAVGFAIFLVLLFEVRTRTLLGRIAFAASIALVLCGFAAVAEWASRTAYVYDRCDVPECGNVQVGKVYTQ